MALSQDRNVLELIEKSQEIESEFEKLINERNLQDVTVLGREIYEENNAVRVEYSIKYIKNIGKSENLLISTLN